MVTRFRVLLFLFITPRIGRATSERNYNVGTPCTKDSDCHFLQAKESSCEDGWCTNAFESGCLYQRLPGWNKKRVCNSEDPPEAAEIGICTRPTFDYKEVRIATGNLESPTFHAWLNQILLSELLGVPTTLETGLPNTIANFHDITGAMQWGLFVSSGSLETAFNYGGDCSLASRSADNYEACSNIIPEYWTAETPVAVERVRRGIMDPPDSLGILSKEGLYIPKFTSEKDPTLLSYIGMQGEENRQKMAETFLRPTLWIDYCEQVSANNCSTPDDVAKRAPLDVYEANMFHREGDFTGHFRATDANNCTMNPKTCTGFFVDYPCYWVSQAEPQFYHLNIALSGDNHGNGTRGVTDWQLVEILMAAIATKSNVITMFSQPDPFYQMLIGTEAELHPIMMPPVTQNCLNHKRIGYDECAADWEVRVGDPQGVCEDPPSLLHKAVSTAWVQRELSQPEVSQSPAVAAFQRYKITNPLIGSWFDLLITNDALGPDCLTAMRDATCQFVVENFDSLVKQWIPPSYPRVIEDSPGNPALVISAVVLGGFAVLLVLAAAATVYRNQHRRVMVLAQVEFLRLLLAGLLLISMGALLAAVPPNNGTCVATIWFINCGYTMELAPLLIKVTAINKLMSASKKMKKVNIDRNDLFRSVFAVTVLIAVFLAIWTGVDAPQKQGELSLSSDTTMTNNETIGIEETVVYRTYYCSSESDAWQYVAFGWTYIMLFSSTVLAFQMRNVRQEFNECMELSFMTYSHFVFAILRLAITFLNELGHADRASYASILLSADSIAALVIYFLPKFMVLRQPDRNPSLVHSTNHFSSVQDRFSNEPGRFSTASGGASCDFTPASMHGQQQHRIGGSNTGASLPPSTFVGSSASLPASTYVSSNDAQVTLKLNDVPSRERPQSEDFMSVDSFEEDQAHSEASDGKDNLPVETFVEESDHLRSSLADHRDLKRDQMPAESFVRKTAEGASSNQDEVTEGPDNVFDNQNKPGKIQVAKQQIDADNGCDIVGVDETAIPDVLYSQGA